MTGRSTNVLSRSISRIFTEAKKPAPFKLLFLLFVLVATLCGSIQAQQDACRYRTIAVNVLSEDVHLVEGLSTPNFRGKVHGHPVEIESVNRDADPRRIVIVLDASGSMGEFWKLEVSAAEGLISADRCSSFALVIFAGRIEHRIDFAQSREKLSALLAGIEWPSKDNPGGGTALRDGLAAALDLLLPAQSGDAIYLVSDVHDNASKVSNSQLKEVVANSGARLFALIPVESTALRGRTAEEAEGPEWLTGFVRATGGDFTIFRLGIDSPAVYNLKPNVAVPIGRTGQQVMSLATEGFDKEITDFYRLTLKLPEPLDKPRELDLDVVDANRKKNNRWLIVYPHRLAACP